MFKTLAPLGLNIEVLSDILSAIYVFYDCYLGLDCLGLNCRLWFCIHFVFALHLWSQCRYHLEAIWSISNANWLIGFCVIWTLWSKCIVLILYVSICSVYLFIWFMLSLLLPIDIINFITCFCCCCCCCCCCLIMFLIHFVVAVVVLLIILLHYWFSVLCCLCWQCWLAPCYQFVSITFLLFRSYLVC